MSWLGVAPFKKFPAPFCTSIAARVATISTDPNNSQANVALLCCRCVTRDDAELPIPRFTALDRELNLCG
jgi:hypothetical protein